MPPEVMVFDIGRVLIGWDPEGFYDRVIGVPARARLFAEVDLHGMNLAIDRGEGFGSVVAACAAAHPAWAGEIMLWHDRWSEMVTGPIEGSVRLLRALKARGVPVLALTNFGRETLQIAQARFDFLNEFDAMVVSGHLGAVKPEPAIYAALESVAHVPPDRLFLADDVAANCAAAAARGWHTHLFQSPEGLAAALLAHGLLTEETLP
ncbi:MAG: HAD family hydrolase [Gemmobacter sp.]|uniref:HAD family hydrolase n=1 Tax=Gemmobacter sp. TaxID=1898957 RepID=UPI00391ADB57